jgi:hypothetical protein
MKGDFKQINTNLRINENLYLQVERLSQKLGMSKNSTLIMLINEALIIRENKFKWKV